MPFDQSTRNFLQRTVTKCREILAGRWQAPTEGEFFRQLQEIYGISPDGLAAPMEVLAHLGDEDRETAYVLRDTIDHYTAGLKVSGKSEKDARREAVMRVAREQAFTVLNRLAALRMAEERGIVLECVRKGTQSEGFQLFLQSAGSAFGSTSSAYRAYLHLLFDELARDLGVLFNRFDKGSLIFPRHEALESLLKELNGTGEANHDVSFSPEQVASLWGEDEMVGWIYQYYNDPSERKKMREESAAPRNSRELAVRNQFFTPRYVVEFLTDNTLGRIWYEMTQGDTTLKEQCRYLVRRPTEIFLQPNEAAPEQPKQDNLSQEDLLKLTVFIPNRPLKDPRTILMLDPACGSMHFGLYAFDLFEVIYDEAWALEERLGVDALSRPQEMKSLHDTYAGKDAFLKDVARLIIENNLHGVDIDPRAAQIAGLSLWLRAQKAWQRLGLAPAERPAIKRSNIVCAEPMPGEKELLREFVEREFPAAERAVCLRLLEAIFDKMQLAGEAGSLLKIEEEIRSAIEDARDAWQKLATKPPELFTTTELNQLSTAPELTGLEQAVSSLTTDPRPLTTDFWERIEERIYAALRDYAEQAENGGGFQRRLFAEDAARGFAFIDVCRKRYDVVLMNPPFGDASLESRHYLSNSYPVSKHDLAAAFVERASSLTKERGSIGCISTRTLFFLPTSEVWRRRIFPIAHLGVFADLGLDVMDAATVYAAAYTFSKQADGDCMFFRGTDWLHKQGKLSSAIQRIREGGSDFETYVRDISIYQNLPGWVIPYYLPANLIEIFSRFHSLGELQHGAMQGLATGDDFRFARSWTEVAPNSIISLAAQSSQSAYIDETANRQAWVPYAKGGSFSPFYQDLGLVVKWNDNGHEIRNFSDPKTGNELSRYRGAVKYFIPGLTFNYRSRRFGVGAMPSGAIFGVTGMGVFFEGDRDYLLEAMAVMNSSPFNFLLFMLCERRDPLFQAGKINSVPWPLKADSTELSELAADGYRDSACSRSLEETSPHFTMPFFSSVGVDSLCHLLNEETRLSIATENRWIDRQQNIDLLVSKLYGIDEVAFVGLRAELVQFLGDNNHDCLGCPTARSGFEVVSCMLSYLVGSVFGRWDIRDATGERQPPELPDPFDPLPVCPPGMLQNAQGLPARPEDVPAAYPVRIPWDGILVDDPNHPLDIERRVREVIEIIWSGKDGGPTAEAIEHEACEILGVKSLRDYFRKPAGFFADHLKRYSKSRRQAPIYWPLATSSGSYTLWIYYHRLTPDTLYKCLQQFVEPKIKDVEQEIHRLRTMLTADEAGTKERKQLADDETLLNELKEMHAELSLWAPKWKPNLNDGVLITASPLWKLFRLPKWRKDLEACWKELEAGDYDWAHLAYTLFPSRVREKCKTDRSIAIAHGLEDLCQVQAPVPKKKTSKKSSGAAAKTPAEVEPELLA